MLLHIQTSLSCLSFLGIQCLYTMENSKDDIDEPKFDKQPVARMTASVLKQLYMLGSNR